MSPEQMKQRSGEKVKQVMDLVTALNLQLEARERINDGGFIENVIFWIDNEKYSQPQIEEEKAEVIDSPDVKQN